MKKKPVRKTKTQTKPTGQAKPKSKAASKPARSVPNTTTSVPPATTNGEPLEAAFLKTLWRELRRAIDMPLMVVRDGHGIMARDPFSGQMRDFGATQASRGFAAKVRALGLHEDSEFMGALAALIEETAHGPIWGLLTAHDGEGYWEDGAQYEIRKNGSALPTHLHEVFARYKEVPDDNESHDPFAFS